MAKSTGWASTIRAVQSPLGLFALALLVGESILGGLALRATGIDFTLIVVGVLTTVLIVVVSVVWLERRRSAALAPAVTPQQSGMSRGGVGDRVPKPLPDDEPWARDSEMVNLCFERRRNAMGLFRSAFKSDTDVYLLTIKSRNVFALIDALLPGFPSGSRLNVLTWDPGDPRSEENPSIKALIGLTPDEPTTLKTFTEEVLNAPGLWDKRRKNWKNLKIEIRQYRSTPTLEGVLVKDRWALVELMPFGVPTELRAGLILKADKDPKAFMYFQKTFMDLWDSNRPL
jgi:hypothetical protein